MAAADLCGPASVGGVQRRLAFKRFCLESLATLLSMTEGAAIEFETSRAEIQSLAVEFDCDEPGPDGDGESARADVNEHGYDHTPITCGLKTPRRGFGLPRRDVS